MLSNKARNVAQEHYCTASTQFVLSQLYPRIFRTERLGRTLVATTVAGELHEFGVRMVADFFEMDGWDTYYLGANTPTPDLLQVGVERKAHLLAISATMAFHLRAVEELIFNPECHQVLLPAHLCRSTTIAERTGCHHLGQG